MDVITAPYFTLDVYLASAEAVLCTDSQIAVLKCVHCQNLHVDTTLTTITSKYICKYSVYSLTWYET